MPKQPSYAIISSAFSVTARRLSQAAYQDEPAAFQRTLHERHQRLGLAYEAVRDIAAPDLERQLCPAEQPHRAVGWVR